MGVFDSLEVIRVLRMMRFPLSQLQQTAVPEGTRRAQEQLFGLYQHQGVVGITAATDEYPNTVTLLAKYMCVVDTEFHFTSIQLI